MKLITRSTLKLSVGFLASVIMGCFLISHLPQRTAKPPEIELLTDIPSPIPFVVDEVDKWTLWTGGTQLRGANIWQRIIIPELDGPEFLGNGYLGPPYTQADFDQLAAMGANYVNISHPGLYSELPPYLLDERVQTNLDHLIEMASRANLFIVITFRTGPGRSDFTFYRDGAGDWFDPDLLIESVWNDQIAQDAWVEMWKYSAERYRDFPEIVGYDLMCEPNGNDVALGIYEAGDFYPEYAGRLYDWNQFYPRIAAAIREVDGETPLLVSGMGWGSVAWLPYLRPIKDERTVYMVHQYEPQEQYTHQDYPAKNTYPGNFDLDWDEDADIFNRQWLEGYFFPIDDFISKSGAPVAVNEFGVKRWVPGAAEFMNDQIELFEERGMNHALWVWDPTWEPWVKEVNEFTFRFGPNLENDSETENNLLGVIQKFWARNRIRPFQP